MKDTYGPTSAMPFASFDHASRCWRTSEDTSLWALRLSFLTLPNWGWLQGGDLYALPTPERPTVAPDCSSSLPTPTARDHKDTEIGPARHRPDDRDTLSRALTDLLPTPTVNDMGAGKDPDKWDEWAARQKAADGRPAPHGKSLEQEAIRLLPTPTRSDYRSPNTNPGAQGGIAMPASEHSLPAVILVKEEIRTGESTAPLSDVGSPSADDPHLPLLFPAPTDDHA